MRVKGMKAEGTTLPDIGMAVSFGEEVDIPHNLARRSKDLQLALDAGHVRPAPVSRQATRPTKRKEHPPRPAARPNPPIQQIAELRRDLGLLTERVATLEDENKDLKKVLSSLHTKVEHLNVLPFAGSKAAEKSKMSPDIEEFEEPKKTTKKRSTKKAKKD